MTAPDLPEADTRDASVLIVGASASGLATAEALRRLGHTGRLTLLDADSSDPYDRPPLSKQLLSGEWEADRVVLRAQDVLDGLGATFLLGDRATRLDVAGRSIATASGRILAADVIVIATGVRPRRVDGQGDLAGIHLLRSVDDALGLRSELRPGMRLVVVGNGVLGSEIAATASGLGVDVTLAGPSLLPMDRQLGDLGARRLADLHAQHGVHLRGGHRGVGFVRDGGRVAGVVLDSGETGETGETVETVDADGVVVAVGSEPATGWLRGSGLQLDDGVVCDSTCRAATGVWAVGDVARWDHLELGATMRLENRTNATEQAIAVARNILGDDAPYTPVPAFWTDQYGTRIQVHGAMSPATEIEVTDGDPAEGRFVAVAHHEGRPVGVLGWAMPKQTRLRRQELLVEAARPLKAG